MIRFKHLPKTTNKPNKISIIDNMRFMRTQTSMQEAKQREEIFDSQIQHQEIIMNHIEQIRNSAEVNQLSTLVDNTTLKQRVIYHLKSKKQVDEKLPLFFRQIQKASKKQLLQANLQSKQERRVQNCLLSENQPFRKNCQ